MKKGRTESIGRGPFSLTGSLILVFRVRGTISYTSIASYFSFSLR